MKPWQYLLTLILSGVCLIMAVSTVLTYQSARRVQADIQRQQVAIDHVRSGQQVVSAIVQDLVRASANNANIKSFLDSHGLIPRAPSVGDTAPAPSSTTFSPKATTPAPRTPKSSQRK